MATSQRIRSLSHDESERTLSKPPVKSRIQSDNRSAKVMTVESTGPIFSTPTEPAIGPCNKSSFRLNDVEKSFNNVVKIVKTAFVEDEIKRAMESNWMLVETDAGEVSALDNALDTLRDAFLFTTSLSESKLDSSAHSIITHCEKVAERIFDQKESREVMVANWNDTNLLPNLQNNLQEIKTLVLPPLNRREKAAELKILKRIERFVSLMSSSLQAMRADLQSFLTDLDKILLECSTLLVEVITFLHMRSRTADFSGTGVAAGAAGLVAGILVTVTALLTAPMSAGLTLPFLVAGKGLIASGVATLAPCSLMLASHNKQLEGLASLVRSLKARLEILFQRREVLVTAYYACIEAEFNIQHVGTFCKDAVELEMPPKDNSMPFMTLVEKKLRVIEENIDVFASDPSVFHYCHEDEDQENGLLYLDK
ncbi:hypothetical protein, variant 1 [Aphanomyces invadans]|uniref:Transmembrane protein n=1 Tax=Aphanomyces invadans TaxID=157072 RepID=A0A024UM53_9STRA|nr:hypothetical protein H310_02030 [Aphanomyces invadans]XP_008863625.1 hypothetical protein, variant 1 [Aphanomyces invadans]ETW07531.1 hypothetical protein H310_02030 [Aphanomyces invadans]ETW07532.1 hypothetical protein, variant 1 [Aphanomyces invadans]|eukprot:XP_008863624.1 hypothetical protein H310_02030 [Aphanomyces invadans]